MKDKNPLCLNPEDWEILKTILRKYNAHFYAYGSRVRGEASPFSDIDLYVMGELPLIALKEELEESDLPMKVDLQLAHNLSSDFLDLIRPTSLLLNPFF